MEKFKQYLNNKVSSEQMDTNIKELFEKLYDFTDNRLNLIENNIVKEYSSSSEGLVIKAALVNKRSIPYAEDLGLFPFEGYNAYTVDDNTITLDGVEPKKFMVHAFAECDYNTFKDAFANDRSYLKGTVYFDNKCEEKDVEFSVLESVVVSSKVADLKYWYAKTKGCQEPTVFIPFENRIVEICLKDSQLYKDTKSKIVKVVFDSIPSILNFDYTPVWNVIEKTQDNATEPTEYMLPFFNEMYYKYKLKPRKTAICKALLDVIPATVFLYRENMLSSRYCVADNTLEILSDTIELFSEAWNLFLVQDSTAQLNNDILLYYYTNQVSIENSFLLNNMCHTSKVPSEMLLRICVNNVSDITHLVFDDVKYTDDTITIYVHNNLYNNSIFSYESMEYLAEYLRGFYKGCNFQVKGANL